MNQQLTAREWIELIADPEIREKALVRIKTDPLEPDKASGNISEAIIDAFIWSDKQGGFEYWEYLVANPPALLPFPNKEREAAESVLVDFLGILWGECSNEAIYK